MQDTDQKRRLLEEFPPHTREDWQKAAEELLKGRPFEKTLVTPTYEGFPLQPIYMADDIGELPWLDELPGSGSRVRGFSPVGYLGKSWRVSQELTSPTADVLNARIQEALAGGQDELNIWLDACGRHGLDPDTARSDEIGICGLSLLDLEEMGELLREVPLDRVSVYWRSGVATPAVAALFFAYAERAGFRLSELTGCLEMDPLHFAVSDGNLPVPLERAYDQMAMLLGFVSGNAPRMQAISVQGHAYHDGGASAVQELAYVLATGTEYIRAMDDRGLTPERVVPHMRLCLSVGSQHFVEIARLRALRILWNRIQEGFGVAEDGRFLHLHARTGLWNKTVHDPYVNMLRTTSEAFAAVVGGCDSLHVSPFDEVIRDSDALSRRIARNTHAILSGECQLHRVVDPAGGSYAVEALTSSIADEAWKIFQQIERDGGMSAALTAGGIQGEVETVRLRKMAAIQRRRDSLVGTNLYPNAGEQRMEPHRAGVALHERLAKSRSAAALRNRDNHAAKIVGEKTDKLESYMRLAAINLTLGQIQQSISGTVENGDWKVDRIPVVRAASEFEELRERALEMTCESGEAPSILQLNLGPSRAYRIRADWTSAFFQTAGFLVRNDVDFADDEAVMETIKATKSRVAVLTADDDAYAARVIPLAKAIKEARPEIFLLLAGAPGEHEQDWRAAGVDDFVNVRVNNYELNRALLERYRS